MNVVDVTFLKSVPGESNSLPTCTFSQTGRVKSAVEKESTLVKIEIYYTSDPHDNTSMYMNLCALSPASMEWKVIESWGKTDLQIWQEELDQEDIDQVNESLVLEKINKRIISGTAKNRLREIAGADFQKGWEYAIRMFS